MATKKEPLDVSAAVDELLSEFMASPAPVRAMTVGQPADTMQGSAAPEWMKRLTKGTTK